LTTLANPPVRMLSLFFISIYPKKIYGKGSNSNNV